MFEYKAVPAPLRAPRVKGLKSTGDRYAHALAESLNAEASGGWQFVRMETVAVEDRTRLGRITTSPQTLMIFQRKLSRADELGDGYATAGYQAAEEAEYMAPHAPAQPEYQPAYEPAYEQPEPQPEYQPEYQPAPQRQEPVFRSGALRADASFQRSEPVLRPRSPSSDDAV